MELLPRTTRAQAMDVLSSQANLAGYKAVVDAMAAYGRVMPMMMTAAGTVTPAKVFIVGAGVAGLQAIATARRMGAVVTATDVRPAAREETESLGAKFVGFVPERRRDQGRLCPAADARGAGRAGEDGGRAPEEPGHRRHHGADPGPARRRGSSPPRWSQSMKPGAVVLDMAAESGGNVEGSEPGQTVAVGGVKLIGARNLPSRIAPATTVLYARNLFNFVRCWSTPRASSSRSTPATS